MQCICRREDPGHAPVLAEAPGLLLLLLTLALRLLRPVGRGHHRQLDGPLPLEIEIADVKGQ
ncbi:MAG: hypothetical protein AB7V46_17525, partial [Thermomicrobiales bacterium]